MMLCVWVTPQRCCRKVDRTLCLCIYGKQCRIDRTLYSTLLNSTHFFSAVDRTLTHFFWSTGWEVLSKSLSHSSLKQALSTRPRLLPRKQSFEALVQDLQRECCGGAGPQCCGHCSQHCLGVGVQALVPEHRGLLLLHLLLPQQLPLPPLLRAADRVRAPSPALQQLCLWPCHLLSHNYNNTTNHHHTWVQPRHGGGVEPVSDDNWCGPTQ